MSFRVIPIPSELADEARRTLLSPGFGHPVRVSIASPKGYGPCRSCLRRTREGERRLFVSYNPYPEPEQVPVVGPIFIHEDSCESFNGAGFPEELRGLPMALRGHYEDGTTIVNQKLEGQDPEAAIEAMFQNPRIAFIAIQNTEASCFIARVVRA
ncbi:MAG TPA: DUF1203 domain-containing protein [Polyangiaceae bacterium]